MQRAEMLVSTKGLMNNLIVVGQRVPVTPKGQSLSPGLPGMALSPGTLLPQLPLHGMHMSQASLINPSQVKQHSYVSQF